MQRCGSIGHIRLSSFLERPTSKLACPRNVDSASKLLQAKAWLHRGALRNTIDDEPREKNEKPTSTKPKRSAEWKRRQDGARFIDETTVRIKAGNGGNGSISFHREKFKPFGPPSGGNGGSGGNVCIIPSTKLSSLDHLSKLIRAGDGSSGLGSWQVGKRGENVVIEVPYGTVGVGVWDPDPNLYESEMTTAADRREERWARRWIHQSGFEGANEERDAWKAANEIMDRDEYERRREYAFKSREEVVIDFGDPPLSSESIDGVPAVQDPEEEPPAPTLLVEGGQGGLGNPAFLTNHNRSPKFASKGLQGESMKLHLQLKLLADIGLVGFPNAGKSTLVRALTGMGTEVGSWAFTTLNPRVGVVKVWEGGHFGMKRVVEETKFESARPWEVRQEGSSNTGDDGAIKGLKEEFRFTIADNPGLIEDASLNVGLGHSFLKSIERSAALVYVVDLSTPSSSTNLYNPPPQKALLSLRDELEKYKPGLSKNARLIVANKADLLVPRNGSTGEGAEATADGEAVMDARERLAELERFVEEEFDKDGLISVIPISAKYGMNLEALVRSMRKWVGESRNARLKERRKELEYNTSLANV